MSRGSTIYILSKKNHLFPISQYTNYKGDLASLLVQLNPLLQPLTTCTYEEKTKRRTYNNITLIPNPPTIDPEFANDFAPTLVKSATSASRHQTLI